MKKILAIGICVCVLAFSLIACGYSSTADAKSKVEENDRFTVMDGVSINFNDTAYILVDNKTDVCYLYTEGVDCCAVTVMVGRDGEPLIWEEN